MRPRATSFLVAASCLVLVAASSARAATFSLINLDGPGEGFNDPTPAAPVGGNAGTTLGQQRLNVFQTAGAIWGALLPSGVTIQVQARFDAQACDSTSGVLGSAGAITVASDFPGAPLTNTWYPIALANKLAATDLAPTANDIQATFNSSVDNGACLGSASWYYGYDHEEGGNIDLLAVVLHELGHGLGFQTFTSYSTGQFLNGRPDVYARNLFDRTYGVRWDQMNSQQRKASATNTNQLVWDGSYAHAHAADFLGAAPVVRIDTPAGLAGDKDFGTADFGPSPPEPPIAGEVVLADDGAVPTTDGCSALVNAAQLAGKIALIDRGTCTFVEKAQRAQAAGAIALIIGNNVAGPAPGMAGSDPTITIPVVSITQDDAILIQDELSVGGIVTATIGVVPGHLAGTDPEGRVRLYAPSPLEGGSSVSHFDVTAAPDLLMEPFINGSLTSEVDLTHFVFTDIGWLGGAAAVANGAPPSAPSRAFSTPNPFSNGTSIRFELARGGKTTVEVFDARGTLVKRLPVSWRPAGRQTVAWDGTDAGGRRVAAGVYLWRIVSEGQRETGRVVRIN
jgi:hypothetical protein